ncbi:uncharacterized protein CCR75_007851 [Bremia lactucae]|uniref:ATPase F1/V1/A1 complex alpha/beta subunit nucleotide-binding domain-containing protein n=1 Tax=Bremia lactucae TaxID=4779 RepID=A0A976FLW8_BRELC|nr:hypothetical protein CCR75_007972 [Bremia lactucae]TDH69083.1 hypothetical protein CCR75_009108 [Bremia lactucae]TDH69098.1 hypothetical protein CCR75_009241 [Bremia lactucae]TDH69102.1 hypothetical protein CCR75_009305 [Bremia lactucae]TDH72482.1 hypothetical protein CCR75_007851 [Bremia lactucae]
MWYLRTKWVSRALRSSFWTPQSQRWCSVYWGSTFSTHNRNFHACGAINSRASLDDSESALAQQMLDFMKLAEDEHSPLPTDDVLLNTQAELPISGVIIGVQNGLARVSGLRHATIGSVVNVSDASGHSISQGLVLFMEEKVVHIALLSARGTEPVMKNMDVTLHCKQLEIPGSVAAFAGAVIDPIGRPHQFDTQAPSDVATANDRIKVTWGTQSVPGLIARTPLHLPFKTGLVAVDCLHPMAHGHRFAVLGPRSSGKTRIALEMMAYQVAQAKANGEQPPQFVFVCIGKSLSRIHQIIDALKQSEALPYTTIIASSDRDSPVLQYLAPFTGCAVAEFLMHNGKSDQSVIVYDDLASHTMVVEGLIQSLKLPRAAHASLSAHTVLMERSAQFKGSTQKEGGPSLTSFVLGDAPDSSEIATEFMERIVSVVDDYVSLEYSLAQSRVFPPINVLAPGASVRGPPFQSATRWKFVSRLRARINAAAQVKQNIETARKLGFETEPEDAEALEFLELVQQFFTQKSMLSTVTPELKSPVLTELAIDLGAYFLTIVNVAQLYRSDTPLELWTFLHSVVATLTSEENADILHQLVTRSRTKVWSLDIQKNVTLVLLRELETMKWRLTDKQIGN